MLKHRALYYACVAFMALPAGNALSDGYAGNGLELSGNIGIVSEYSFRGIAQSDEGPAIQGGFDVNHDSGFYAGMWGSQIDFNDNEADLEIDLYAGFENTVESFVYNVGVIYYAYPGVSSSRNYDFYELALSVGYDFDIAAATASVNYSPDYFGGSGKATYLALGVDIPLPYDLTASAHIGHQSIEDNTAFGIPDYYDWSVGLNYNFKGFDLSATYIDTDLDEPGECADGCEQRVIFAVTYGF